MNSPDHGEVETAIAAQRASIERNAVRLAQWVETPEPLWSSRPRPEAWSVREILEHVVLTQHYLLLLIEKIARRAHKRRAAGGSLPERASPTDFIDVLAGREFRWTHPEHMAPTDSLSREQIARRLAEQTAAALQHLAQAPRGEGALASLRMSVVDAHLDLYQYLHVLDCHAARHLAQLERNRAAFEG